MKRATILYLSFDGLLQPIGYSQVFRVVSGLAREGFRYEVLSFERARDLADQSRVRRLEQALRAEGIPWHPLRYDEEGGARSASSNLSRIFTATASRLRRGEVGLIHARGYHAGIAALMAERAMGVPYLFDPRGYWIDERIDDGRWFTNPATQWLGRSVERKLYARAAAVVTLTELHAADVRSRLDFGGALTRPVVAIPTCADYEEFVVAPRTGQLTLGLIGSTNRSYHTDAAVRLCRFALQCHDEARLLVLTQQRREMEAVLRRHSIPSARFAIATATPETMPSRLREIDWGVMLLSQSRAKRASMPTKLAEFFAAGVRPVHYGCNAEVESWVRRAGSGYVLSTLSDPELQAAASYIVSVGRADRAVLDRARVSTESHFSVATGVARYARILRTIEGRA